MSRKPKFRPVVTRVKLNPEQAVLACNCWSGTKVARGNKNTYSNVCVANERKISVVCRTASRSSTS